MKLQLQNRTCKPRFRLRYRRDTARFEMQPMKHGNFEQQIRNCAGIHSLFTKKDEFLRFYSIFFFVSLDFLGLLLLTTREMYR